MASGRRFFYWRTKLIKVPQKMTRRREASRMNETKLVERKGRDLERGGRGPKEARETTRRVIQSGYVSR